MWVYDFNTYTENYDVGFFTPDKVFTRDSSHEMREDAVARVSYLNGGAKPGMALNEPADYQAMCQAWETLAHALWEYEEGDKAYFHVVDELREQLLLFPRFRKT
jgi:hypothetical protein